MRIKSIKTSKYKNLRDIQLDFGADLITLLVGQNGLGKSNLIEILTFIFKDLYTITKKKDFIASANKSELNDYTIEYECRGIDVKIDYDDGNQLSIYTKRQSEDYESMSFAEYQRNAKTLLPNRIVGYYSGENKRLERMLDKYTEKDKKRQSNTYKDGNETQKLRSIFFSENKHSQLILFTLAMYWEHPEIGQSVDKILTDLLGINKIIGFDLTFKSPSFFKLKENEKRLEYYEGEILSSNDYSKFDNDHIFWGIKGSVDSLLKVFLFEYLGSSSCTIYEENNKEYFTINENLIGQSSLFEKIYTTFPDPLDFFNALEATSSIGVLEDIKLNISKIGDDDDYNFTALSEGEQQLISVLGLMAILKDDKEEVLYLIDEPDTHINPKWQRNFVQLLLDNIGDNQYRHMFISTHSPFLVQAYNKDVDILLFRKDKELNKIIIDIADHTIKNWRIDQVLMSEYFGLESTRPSSIDIFMSKRLSIIQKCEITEKDKEELRELENELGFLPTGETIDELESMVYINKAAKRFRKEDKQV